MEGDAFALSAGRPEGFSAASDIVADDGVGRLEHGGGGSVVLFQFDDLHLGEVLFHVEEVGDFCAAPAVDALVIVAHHAEVAVFGGQGMNQFELGAVGVLVFVDHDELVVVPAGLQGFGMVAKQSEGQENEVVEIDGIAGLEGGFVAVADMFEHGEGIGVRTGGGLPAVVLEPAEHGEDGGGIDLVGAAGDAGEDAFHGAQLVAFVIDHEVAFVAEVMDVVPEDANAEGVEGADGGPGLASVSLPGRFGQEFANAFLHFAGGLVGEGDGEDVVRCDAFPDHVGDAEGDDSCFAGAGACEDEDRAAEGFHGLALLWV